MSYNDEDVVRSAPMTLVQLYVPREAARAALAALGQEPVLQVRDLNAKVTGFNRPFVANVRKLDEALRQVASLDHIVRESGVIRDYKEPSLRHVEDLLKEPLGSANDVDQLIESITNAAVKITHLASSRSGLAASRDRLLERRAILKAAGDFFGGNLARSPSPNPRWSNKRHRRNRTETEGLLDNADIDDPAELEEALGLEDDGFDIEDDSYGETNTEGYTDNASELGGGYRQETASSTNLGEGVRFRTQSPFAGPLMDVVGGSIDESKYASLERLCWRAARGNLVISRYPIEHFPNQTAFILYTHGQNTASKLRKMAESMEAHLQSVSSDADQRRLELNTLNGQLSEAFAVLDSTTEALQFELLPLIDLIPAWKAALLKERAVYEVLNRFDSDEGRRTLIGEGWLPTNRLSDVQDLLRPLAQGLVIHEIRTDRTPPTMHATNKLTAAFQAMIDVYGIARYQEINAGLPTVITFPFMFAIMFGDVGHGVILASAASVLCIFEKRIAKLRRDEVFDMAFGGRYVLLLMGLFSIYTGLLYNDIFSLSMTFFNSGWIYPKETKAGETLKATFSHAYPFGLDWAWHGAENALSFTNSYKMKLSVLMGFAHMTYSLMFSLFNARYFDSWVDIWGNFVPGFLFMQSIFGYLSLAIVYKWCVNWFAIGKEPPNLLNMLINMFLSPGTIEAPLYAGQKYVQIILVLIALVCVPWLLLFKPMYLSRLNKAAQAQGYTDLYSQSQHDATYIIEEEAGDDMVIHEESATDEEGAHSHKFDMGEIVVHQVIHTIEFCLNCVSHTASYLRLWALSLAHNQLSTVLWNMTIRNAFGITGASGVFATVFLFGMWFVITVLVLVCMEGTSAMLHSLRLHWVEAMSKHFEGEGYAFEPFAFSDLITQL